LEFCKIKYNNGSECLRRFLISMVTQITNKKILNVPNALSFFRLLMIIPFLLAFLKDMYVMSIAVLCVSGITDILDGFIARKTGQITKFGTIIDPLADKFTLIAVVVSLSIKFPELLPFVGVLLIKDFSMIVVAGVFIWNKIEPPAARWYGKLSTALFYVSTICSVCLSKIFFINCTELSVILFSITTIFMIFSLVRYFVLCLNLIKS